MQIRNATPQEMNEIYMMGFDVWADGASEDDYLEGCHNSPKYKKGSWWVLEDQGKLVSSLIVYNLGEGIYGIGSIATPPECRRQGYASRLTESVSEELEEQAKAIFLFADIKPEFYEKLGYVRLPANLQKYDSSTCMVRSTKDEQIWNQKSVDLPTYF